MEESVRACMPTVADAVLKFTLSGFCACLAPQILPTTNTNLTYGAQTIFMPNRAILTIKFRAWMIDLVGRHVEVTVSGAWRIFRIKYCRKSNMDLNNSIDLCLSRGQSQVMMYCKFHFNTTKPPKMP